MAERKQRLSLGRGLCGSKAGTKLVSEGRENTGEPGQTEPHRFHYSNYDGKPRKVLSRDLMFVMGKGMPTDVGSK